MSADGRRYRVHEVLGRGGFGTVYRGEMIGGRGFTKPVALKVLNAEVACVEEVAERLRDEARLLALLRHRAIVQVDSLVLLDGHWTMVMELIDGVDLRRLVANAGPVPPSAALEIVREVASALHAAFDRAGPDGTPLHVLHRDIKPSNIQITRAGEVKVLDFGVARADFSAREARTQALVFGSSGYIAPERLFGLDTHAGDVYGLGVVLYEMLLGRNLGALHVADDGYEKQLMLALDALATASPSMSALDTASLDGLERLLSECLAFEPEARPSALEVDRRVRALIRKIGEPWLADWAEKVVRETPLDANSGVLTGRILSEAFPSPDSAGASFPERPEGAFPLFPFAPPLPHAVTSFKPVEPGISPAPAAAPARDPHAHDGPVDTDEPDEHTDFVQSPPPTRGAPPLSEADTTVSPLPAGAGFFVQAWRRPESLPEAGREESPPAGLEEAPNTEWVPVVAPAWQGIPDPGSVDALGPALPRDPRLQAVIDAAPETAEALGGSSEAPTWPGLEDSGGEEESIDGPRAVSTEQPPAPAAPGPARVRRGLMLLSASLVVVLALLVQAWLPSALTPPDASVPPADLPPATLPDIAELLGDPPSDPPGVDLPRQPSNPVDPGVGLPSPGSPRGPIPPSRTNNQPMAFVIVEGVDAPMLVSERGEVRPGEIPAGRYTVLARFPSGFADSTLAVAIQAGTRVTVRCEAAYERCRVHDVSPWNRARP